MAKALKTENHPADPEKVADDEGPDRKTRIIRSAEMLIAKNGYHAVNIREIADHAGVPLGLVRYYYGAKAEMFHAIFKRWSHVNEQRIDLLADVMANASQPHLLRRILEVFTLPVLAVQKTEEGSNYVTLVMRELMLPIEEAEAAVKEFFDPLARAFLSALAEAFPHANKEQLGWGYQFVVGTLLSYLHRGRALRLLDAAPDAASNADAEVLLDTMVGGLNAAMKASKAPTPIRPVATPRVRSTQSRGGSRP